MKSITHAHSSTRGHVITFILDSFCILHLLVHSHSTFRLLLLVLLVLLLLVLLLLSRLSFFLSLVVAMSLLRSTIESSISLWLFLAFALLLSDLSVAFVPNSSSSSSSMQMQMPSPMMMMRLKATSPQSAAQEAERLNEQARKLREEIESFQQTKDNLEKEDRQKIQAELDEKQAWMNRYSAEVPILKPDGSTVYEQVQFPPIFKESKSDILVYEASLPLGIILGEHETIPGMTAVDEVAGGSNGEAAGIQVGDLLRACTSCRVEMDQPMWQLMAGGIGRPKTMRFMFGTDYQPFEQVMEAVAANRMDPEERPVLLVVERQV
jgi:hypothetical protein